MEIVTITEFHEGLSYTFSQDESQINQGNIAVLNFYRENFETFFDFISQTLLNPEIPLNIKKAAIAATRKSFTLDYLNNSEVYSFREKWCKLDEELIAKFYTSIFTSLFSETNDLQKLSANVIALIFKLEKYSWNPFLKLFENIVVMSEAESIPYTFNIEPSTSIPCCYALLEIFQENSFLSEDDKFPDEMKYIITFLLQLMETILPLPDNSIPNKSQFIELILKCVHYVIKSIHNYIAIKNQVPKLFQLIQLSLPLPNETIFYLSYTILVDLTKYLHIYYCHYLSSLIEFLYNGLSCNGKELINILFRTIYRITRNERKQVFYDEWAKNEELQNAQKPRLYQTQSHV